jgi:hypothetical protein
MMLNVKNENYDENSRREVLGNEKLIMMILTMDDNGNKLMNSRYC